MPAATATFSTRLPPTQTQAYIWFAEHRHSRHSNMQAQKRKESFQQVAIGISINWTETPLTHNPLTPHGVGLTTGRERRCT